MIQPQITVIVPVYNATPYLRDCLESILNQSCRDFELLCVDDGSDDASPAILHEYAARDARITVLHQCHQYAGLARNLGMKHARGEYLLFLDADDFFAPTMFESALKKTRSYRADICVFKAMAYDNQTQKYSSMPWTCNIRRCPKNAAFSIDSNPEHIYSFTTPAPWSKIFRTEFVRNEAIQFQATRSSNDLLFVMTALTAARRITVLDENLAYYRRNTGTSLQETQTKEPFAFYKALCAFQEELIKRNLFQKAERGFLPFALDCCLHNLKTLRNDLPVFKEVCFFLRDEAFPNLGLNFGERKDFDDYSQLGAHIYDLRNDINTLAPDDLCRKYLIHPYTDTLEKQSILHAIRHLPQYTAKLLRYYKNYGVRQTLAKLREIFTSKEYT